MLIFHIGGDIGNASTNGEIKTTRCNLSIVSNTQVSLDHQLVTLFSERQTKSMSVTQAFGLSLSLRWSQHSSVCTGILDGIGAFSLVAKKTRNISEINLFSLRGFITHAWYSTLYSDFGGSLASLLYTLLYFGIQLVS